MGDERRLVHAGGHLGGECLIDDRVVIQRLRVQIIVVGGGEDTAVLMLLVGLTRTGRPIVAVEQGRLMVTQTCAWHTTDGGRRCGAERAERVRNLLRRLLVFVLM